MTMPRAGLVSIGSFGCDYGTIHSSGIPGLHIQGGSDISVDEVVTRNAERAVTIEDSRDTTVGRAELIAASSRGRRYVSGHRFEDVTQRKFRCRSTFDVLLVTSVSQAALSIGRKK